MKAIALSFVVLCCGLLQAQQNNVREFADHQIFFSAFNSTSIPPEVAKQHRLTRSKINALVNITVMDKASNQPIAANVSGNATNLVGQMKNLAFKEIREADRYYYLAQFRVSDAENFTFNIKVRIPGRDEPYEFKFRKTMYTN